MTELTQLQALKDVYQFEFLKLALVLDTTPTFKPLEKHPEIKECNERLFRADDRCNIQKALENVRGQIILITYGRQNNLTGEPTDKNIIEFIEK
ncbi:302_t:CDS:2 [Entrophospora sp. SA101]|nr:302_t:CDS:2 [Entrophospora sp. SA101]